jgi:hypothetical protein
MHEEHAQVVGWHIYVCDWLLYILGSERQSAVTISEVDVTKEEMV